MSIGRELRAGAGKRGIGTSGRSSGRLKGEKEKGFWAAKRTKGDKTRDESGNKDEGKEEKNRQCVK